MNDSSIQSVSQPDEAQAKAPAFKGTEPAAPAEQLHELQELLFGVERKRQIERLQEDLNDPEKLTPKVSLVLPDAISARATGDHQLTEAITPYVVESIKLSARRHPEHISEAIFPIIGPAIRRAIAQAFNNLTQTINQTLQHSFSLRGLKWRMEAYASGKSFAEVVLYHSLLYRVEQVFLIHRKTGLVLLHVAGESVQTQDADVVSGMLTAIQDFIQDSFGESDGEPVGSLQIGARTVLTEVSPQAVLACVVRGTVPAELREEMQEALESIHRDRGKKFLSFEGDAAPFEICRPILESLLQSQYQSFADPAQTQLPKSALAVIGVLLLALCTWGFFSIRDRLRWNNYLAKLSNSPGIVVTEAERGWRKYHLVGLRDPLTIDPAQLMGDFNLDAAKLNAHWEEYQSAKLAEARAKKLLNPPSGVTLNVRDDILYVTGSASQQWLAEASRLALFIPGITQFRLHESDFEKASALKKEIESERILFFEAAPSLASSQEVNLALMAGKIRQLDEIAGRTGQQIRLKIIGQTDSSGTKEANLALSKARANQVKAQLELRTSQLKNTKLITEGIGDQHSLSGKPEENRRVSFKIE